VLVARSTLIKERRVMPGGSIVPKLLATASLVLAAVALAGPVFAAGLDPAVLQRTEAAAVQLGVPVGVARTGQDGVEGYVSVAVGSGTVISPDGLILTNHHVVDSKELAKGIGLPVVENR
jgi:S1-C subfamily serine protease